jgi:CobQ/CobB/MinD/ParA nucleotide binding domain
MSIITVATTKGGAGKTTLARLILGRTAQMGLAPAAIDADFNRTLTDWATAFAKHPMTVRHELDETRIVPLVGDCMKRTTSSSSTRLGPHRNRRSSPSAAPISFSCRSLSRAPTSSRASRQSIW